MTYPDAGADPRRRDPRVPPERWSEASGTSVFGPPDGPPQADRGAYGGQRWSDDPRRYHVPAPPPGYPDGDTWPEPPTRQLPPADPPTRQFPPPRVPLDRPPAPRRQPRPRRPDPGRDERGRRRRDARRVGMPVGIGTLAGTAGLVCLALALMVLPWFRAGGQDVTLSDIRTAFTLPEAQADGLVPGAEEAASLDTSDGIPTPAEAAAAVVDTGKARYLELYADQLWMAVVGAAALAVVFSTILAPRSFALSLLLGFRRLSGLVTILAGAAHGVALWIVFTGDDAPEPAFGVWLGVAGLGGVLLGCILGPKRLRR